ncbi:MAG: hypothetical protein ABI432_02600 [Flavobacteriales bacterium]
MADITLPIANMVEVLQKRSIPAVTRWNRLEGRPRTHHFDRALKAEVRDALWMLTRQWQLGELRADDAGSPVLAKVHVAAEPLSGFSERSGAATSFDPLIPLEAQVERHPIPFTLDGRPVSIDLRMVMGREWMALVRPLLSPDQIVLFKTTFTIEAPDPNDPADDHIIAHRGTWQRLAALSGRAVDGMQLLERLKGTIAPRDFTVILPEIPLGGVDLDRECDRFIAFCDRLFPQPRANRGSWVPDRLEYQFGLDAASSSFKAKEYYQGHLDWYNLDLVSAGPNSPSATNVVHTFLPTPVKFSGMPNTRWWKFEDERVNIGAIAPDSTDLVKLVVMEFGLIYANDWFNFPVRLKVGQWCNVKGLIITNTFGEKHWITAASRDTGTERDSTMFTLADATGLGTSPSAGLLLLPTVPKVQESDALESFVMARDEMANMVWAMETTVPMADGRGRAGKEVASELRTRMQKRLDDDFAAGAITDPAWSADIRYRLMTSVPEHWIPFISVHEEGSNRQTKLQRSSMPRIMRHGQGTPQKVKPRGQLLREGLDDDSPAAYFVQEEEATRAGIEVTRTFQRTRWTDGSVHVWMGMRKGTGRGEGSSGLRFDFLQPRKELFQPVVLQP